MTGQCLHDSLPSWFRVSGVRRWQKIHVDRLGQLRGSFFLRESLGKKFECVLKCVNLLIEIDYTEGRATNELLTLSVAGNAASHRQI